MFSTCILTTLNHGDVLAEALWDERVTHSVGIMEIAGIVAGKWGKYVLLMKTMINLKGKTQK